MKKSRIKTIIIAVSVIAFLVYLVLVIGINLKYPKAQLEEKQIGEAMTADDFEITATDVSFMSQEDFSDIYAFEKEMFKEAECIMVTVNIKNMSEEKQRVTLEGFTLTSQAWTTCTAPDKYMAVNEKWNSEQAVSKRFNLYRIRRRTETDSAVSFSKKRIYAKTVGARKRTKL